MVGGESWPENPRIIVSQPWHDFVRLWGVCRGDAGIAHWPDVGGVSDQAAWVIEGFGLLGGMYAEHRKQEQPNQ